MAESTSVPLKISGKTLDVRELTIDQCREWLKERVKREAAAFGSDNSAATEPVDIVDWMMFEGATLHDIAFMSNLKPSDIGQARPSEVQKALDLIKEENPHFFAMRARAIKTFGEAIRLGRW